MEIRSSLKKIDNYLKIVSDLNKAILEEGTMAPEELQIMKKYLYVCAERVEDIQIKLGLASSDNDKALLNELESNEQESEVTVTEFAEITQPINNEQEEERDILKELESSDKSTINVLNNFVEAEIEKSEISDEEVVESKVAEITNIQDERIMVEPVVFLSADLPSIRYNSSIDFEQYAYQIIDERIDAKNAINAKGEIINNTNVLVADDIEEVEEKIEFKANAENKETVELVSDEQAIKPEFKSTTDVAEQGTLVADDIEEAEEKIEFKANAEKQEIVKLVSDEQTIMPNLNTTSDEIKQNTLVIDDVEKEKVLVNFEQKVESEEGKKHFDLVDTTNEKTEEVNIFSKALTNGTEYESIVNRKSLSEQIALNDKFIFVRELFASQFSEYESSIKEIDVFENYQDALDFCTNVLAVKYNWDAKKNISERFLNILNKKYNL